MMPDSSKSFMMMVTAARLSIIRWANSAREIPPGVNRIRSSIECLLIFFTLGLGGDQRKSLTAAIHEY
jgi:hypothetical protein